MLVAAGISLAGKGDTAVAADGFFGSCFRSSRLLRFCHLDMWGSCDGRTRTRSGGAGGK